MLKIGIIFLAVIAAVMIAVIICDTHRFIIRRYEMASPKIRRDCRLVVLADLHNRQYGEGNRKLLKAIEEQKPDMILVAGDMMVSVPDETMEPAVHLIRELARTYPVYYGLGNHESRIFREREVYGSMGKRFRKQIGRSALFLGNENVWLPEYGIRIYGLELDRHYYKKFKKIELEQEELEKCIGKPDSGACNILLAHNPEYFDAYAKWGADLVLSGHVHGGIMRLPWIGGVIATSFKLFPKYDGGLFQKGKSSMVVSRGLGTHTIPVRVFNPGELVVIDLKYCA